ncbi:MAG: branched-chain amino acid ABC transporter permease, partial [Alphaproteobacteria bacterium]|nr:branched-chain amino acid ABC transporter permease [Alphaproteobacteria bacterium]
RRRSSVVLVISSLGVSLMLRSLIQLVWGPDNQVYQAGIQLPIDIAGLRIKPNQIVIVVGAVVLVTALHVFLSRTKMGKAMRATADNRDLAQTAGIDIGRVILWTWIIGALLAAAAGIFLAIDTRLHPFMGRNILLAIFAAAILGGIGKPYGAIAGGLTIGIAEEMSTLVLSPAYKSAVAFAIMVAMLIFRPTGLFGGR